MACKEIPSDRVYSLKLERAPAEEDWARASVHSIRVVGGRPHKDELFPDIDQDTVHTSTASCHHGAALPEPILVEMRSFYTDSHLFVQLSWADPTPDHSIRQWWFDGTSWRTGGGLEDGFGILWINKGEFASFSCARACHLDDFGVQSARFEARSRMRLAEPGKSLDLWHWKAGRTGQYGFADDRFLDHQGMHGDNPAELFRENSRASIHKSEGLSPFSEGDQPVYAENGRVFDGSFIPAGTTAPGYVTDLPGGDRADITAISRYASGRWTVVLQRKLDTGSARDLRFVSGQEYAFGLSIMDNTLHDHYASKSEETLRMVAAEN